MQVIVIKKKKNIANLAETVGWSYNKHTIIDEVCNSETKLSKLITVVWDTLL